MREFYFLLNYLSLCSYKITKIIYRLTDGEYFENWRMKLFALSDYTFETFPRNFMVYTYTTWVIRPSLSLL
jgi:hypothetical protein